MYRIGRKIYIYIEEFLYILFGCDVTQLGNSQMERGTW